MLRTIRSARKTPARQNAAARRAARAERENARAVAQTQPRAQNAAVPCEPPPFLINCTSHLTEVRFSWCWARTSNPVWVANNCPGRFDSYTPPPSNTNGSELSRFEPFLFCLIITISGSIAVAKNSHNPIARINTSHVVFAISIVWILCSKYFRGVATSLVLDSSFGGCPTNFFFWLLSRFSCSGIRGLKRLRERKTLPVCSALWLLSRLHSRCTCRRYRGFGRVSLSCVGDSFLLRLICSVSLIDHLRTVQLVAYCIVRYRIFSQPRLNERLFSNALMCHILRVTTEYGLGAG